MEMIAVENVFLSTLKRAHVIHYVGMACWFQLPMNLFSIWLTSENIPVSLDAGENNGPLRSMIIKIL